MKYVDEYRDAQAAQQYAEAIRNITTGSWNIMEVCGGQTHAIVRYGIQDLLPESISLVHGPGCPVCVTALERVDKAIEIAARPGVIFCSFGDMLRVPGSEKDLLTVRAEGADVRVVYSPLDALRIADNNKDKEIVFFAVGFETTAPANAMAVYQAAQTDLDNFSVLVSQVLVPPAIEAIMSSRDNQVQGFLAAGHVCAVMGYTDYHVLAKKYNLPIVVTGFEPVDILQGLYMCIKQLEQGRAEVENQYSRVVEQRGNKTAQDLIAEIYCVIPQQWRGIGEIPKSGWRLRDSYQNFDAENRFNLDSSVVEEPAECISGQVLLGLKKPNECPAFGKMCTPEHPLGATMVSGEGACAAYYRYRQTDKRGAA